MGQLLGFGPAVPHLPKPGHINPLHSLETHYFLFLECLSCGSSFIFNFTFQTFHK